MFLTCPSCKTKFKVPENAIKAEGRKVRCASCTHIWHATLADVSAAPPQSVQTASPAGPAPSAQPAGPKAASSVSGQQQDAGLQQMARPSARPMPPVMPKEQAQAQTAAIRKAMMEEAGLDGDDADQTAPEPDKPAKASKPAKPAPKEDGISDLVADPSDRGGDVRESQSGAAVEDDEDHENEDLYGGFGDDEAEDLGGLGGLGEGDDDDDDDDDVSVGDRKDAMARLLASDDDDPIMQHRMKQKRDYERRLKRGRRFVKNILLLGLIILWGAAIVGFIVYPDFVKTHWPASQVIYDQIESGVSEEEFIKEAKEKGEPISEKPTEKRQDLQMSLPAPELFEKNGEQYLRVTGWVEYRGSHGITLPQLVMVLLDADGNRVESWPVVLESKILARGGRLDYTTESPWPVPAGVQAVNIDTIWPEGSPPAAAPTQ